MMARTFSVVLVSLLVLCQHTHFTAAQGILSLISSLPGCAQNCVNHALPSITCSLTDITCLCTDQDLWTNVTACAVTTCTTRNALTTLKLAKETCGVPIRDRSAVLTFVSPILLAVAALFVILRIIARSPRRFELLGTDDWLIVSAWVTGVPLVIGHFYLVHNGMGKDIWEVSFHQITQMLFWFYVTEPFYIVSTILFKLSVLAFYLRLFTEVKLRATVYTLMGICGATAIGCSFAVIFQCAPVSYAWTHWDNQFTGSCIDLNAASWSHAVINIILDLIVLVLPLPQLTSLRFSYTWRDKIQIVAMFHVGLIVTLISGLRLRSLVMFATTTDPTYDYLDTALWSGIEVFTGVICACLPTARVFIMRILPKWLNLSRSGTSSDPTRSGESRMVPGRWKQPSSRSQKMSTIESTANFYELKDGSYGKFDRVGVAM